MILAKGAAFAVRWLSIVIDWICICMQKTKNPNGYGRKTN